MTFSILPASDFGIDEIVDVLNASYEDYLIAVRFNARQYRFFVQSHDIILSQSAVAESDGRLVGLAQMAQRGERGWVGGLGVRPEFRHRGIARALMETMMANAGERGIARLQLEVLSQNERALALYRDLGWVIQRGLLIWHRAGGETSPTISPEPLQSADPARILADCHCWHQEPPCWQREKATLEHYIDLDMEAWTVVQQQSPVAYALGISAGKQSMHMLDIAVDPAIGVRGAGWPLLQALHASYPDTTMMLTNEPEDSPINSILAALAYRVVHKQWEMWFGL